MAADNKPLGFWTLISLLVGSVIGSGIFLLPSALAKFGSISLIGWCISACGVICIALVFANLGRAFPRSGGPYVFCHKAFGDFIGFQNAYIYWIAIWIGNTALLVAFVSYLGFFWPAVLYNRGLAFVISSALLWTLTIINIRGVKAAAIAQLVITVLKLLPFAVLIFWGIFKIEPHYLKSFNISSHGNFTAITMTVTMCLWAFLGIESATIPGGLVKNPERNIPLATIFGAITVAVIYLSSSFVIMSLLPMQTLAISSSPFTDAAVKVLGNFGGYFIGIGALVAIIGSANGFILFTGQIAKAAADDGLFPRIFKRTSKNNAPIAGLITSSICANLLLIMNFNDNLINQFAAIISLAVFANVIPYLYCSIGYFIFKKQNLIPISKGKMTLYSITTIIAVVFVVWAIIGTGEKTLVMGLFLLLSSVPMYFLVCKKK